MTYSAIGHEITIDNRTGTNVEVGLGDWFWIVQGDQVLKLPNVAPGSAIVSTNGGWTFEVDSAMSTIEDQEAILTIGMSNGVQVPLLEIRPGIQSAYNHGKWLAFGFIGFAIALSLSKRLQGPSRETD